MRNKTTKTAPAAKTSGKANKANKNWLAVGKSTGKTISVRSETKTFAVLIATMIIVDEVRITRVTAQEQLMLAILGGVPVFDQEAWEAGLAPII